jgi:hypothetical protein
MNKAMIVAATVLLVASCAQSRRDYNAVGGAIVGGGSGAVIGGVATRTASGALAGGLIGAAAGAIIGAAATPNGPCYARTRYGRLRRVPCYY